MHFYDVRDYVLSLIENEQHIYQGSFTHLLRPIYYYRFPKNRFDFMLFSSNLFIIIKIFIINF